MSDEVQQSWKTNDMALAVYLRIQGIKENVIWDNNVCYWEFDNSDELQKHVIVFAGGQAQVDPKEYNKTFYTMKQEMYKTFGAPTKRN